jgi:hypothetical protein
MSETHLATYLRDHRAGAEAAVELLQHLEGTHPDTGIATFARNLRDEIDADIRELESVMGRVGVEPSAARNATAWLSGKAAELKMIVDDPGGRSLRLLETFESLSLGIEGKRSLWRALATVADRVPILSGIDYARLTRRAEEQRAGVEEQRLAAARAALDNSRR